MKKTIEIVVHCLADPYPVFASLLTAQLSSLVKWTPKNCYAAVVVCCTARDEATLKVIDAFDDYFADMTLGAVSLRHWPMSLPELYRRGYGRNRLCKQTEADIVWLTDCDYLFGDGCLDALAAMPGVDRLVWPQRYLIHKSHAIADAEIARIVPGEIFTPDLSLFQSTRAGYAIGGMQILPRDVARLGYLDGTKWSQPDPSATRFSFAEDRRYRGGPAKQINLPNVLRFRHSVCDYEPAARRLASTEDK